MGDDEAFCFIGDGIGDVLVFPGNELTSGYSADVGGAVDYRTAIPLTGF